VEVDERYYMRMRGRSVVVYYMEIYENVDAKVQGEVTGG